MYRFQAFVASFSVLLHQLPLLPTLLKVPLLLLRLPPGRAENIAATRLVAPPFSDDEIFDSLQEPPSLFKCSGIYPASGLPDLKNARLPTVPFTLGNSGYALGFSVDLCQPASCFETPSIFWLILTYLLIPICCVSLRIRRYKRTSSKFSRASSKC